MSNLQQLLYSKKQAAEQLGISIRKLDYLITEKELDTRRIGRRVLISRQSLEQFIRQDH